METTSRNVYQGRIPESLSFKFFFPGIHTKNKKFRNASLVYIPESL